jgi:phosphatidylglycerol lysyltransferase
VRSGDADATVRTVLGLTLVAAALFVLRHEVDALGWAGLRAAVAAIPGRSVAAAALLTLLNYAVLTCFDRLAFKALGLHAAAWRIGMASFVGYALTNVIGLPALTGTSVRYRFYSRLGLTAEDVTRVVVFCSTMFWLGLLVLGGLMLTATPLPVLKTIVPPPLLFMSGLALLAAAVTYAALPLFRRTALRVGGWQFPVPRGPTIAAQFGLSTTDWVIAAAVLWVLLPAPRPAFPEAAGAFLASQLAGLVSHVPGGVGVFESSMVLFMTPAVPVAALLPVLVAYRVIYYLVPFAFGMAVFTVDEWIHNRDAVVRFGAAAGRASAAVVPRLLAAATFIGGAMLLFSGATPAVASRISWMSRVVPVPLLEASHFAASVLGVVLLLLSRALALRIDAAWTLSMTAIAAAILASLLKGGDYEEAALLLVLLLCLAAARRRFDRRAAAFDAPLSASWFAAVVAVIAASIFLGNFAYRHIAYSNELWWRFAFDADAPRFLRASVGASMVALAFGVRGLLRPAPPAESTPDDQDLADAAAAIARQPATYPHLVFLRDKVLLWNDDRSAFLMYAVQGRTWAALHDPVAPLRQSRSLVDAFLARADDYGGTPVFYEVSPAYLQVYADAGLSLAKIGEEAMVPLRRFSLDGKAQKGRRTTLNRFDKARFEFRVLPASEVSPRIPELRKVSGQWLAGKTAAEKGFSLGFFDPDYLARCPLAVLERDGVIHAFANLWIGADGTEASIDLVRYSPEAPPGASEALFTHLLLWARREGFLRFSLGVAPLSGLAASRIGTLWTPVARYVYKHGEPLYPFQGLRAFKEKFDPEWEPRYLAYPGGLTLPRVLTDVSALIAGGYRRIFFRSK